MITINSRYLRPGTDCNAICEQLEQLGHTVATTDKEDLMYEYDQLVAHKQNLSPHDWENEAEYWDMYRALMKTEL